MENCFKGTARFSIKKGFAKQRLPEGQFHKKEEASDLFRCRFLFFRYFDFHFSGTPVRGCLYRDGFCYLSVYEHLPCITDTTGFADGHSVFFTKSKDVLFVRMFAIGTSLPFRVGINHGMGTCPALVFISISHR